MTLPLLDIFTWWIALCVVTLTGFGAALQEAPESEERKTKAGLETAILDPSAL
jgi:hypothetical protein